MPRVGETSAGKRSMQESDGWIWDFHAAGNWIVISTNIGWKKNGDNVMGAGIALAAAQMYPELPSWYGWQCQQLQEFTSTMAYPDGRLFLFPVKPLDVEKPWYSWSGPASLDLVRRSAEELHHLKWRRLGAELVGIPMVGCNNGRLSPDDVLPILHEHLDETFILFRK